MAASSEAAALKPAGKVQRPALPKSQALALALQPHVHQQMSDPKYAVQKILRLTVQSMRDREPVPVDLENNYAVMYVVVSHVGGRVPPLH